MPIEVAPFVLIFIVIAIVLFYCIPNLIYSLLSGVAFEHINIGIGIINSVIWWSIIAVIIILLYRFLKSHDKMSTVRNIGRIILSTISNILMFVFCGSIIISIGLIITWIILSAQGKISNGGERIAFTVITGFIVSGLSLIFGAMAMEASESITICLKRENKD